MPSIRDVAREAGVSTATVSRVINGTDTVAPDLRKRVMKAVEACNYAPSTGRRTLDNIALVYTGVFCTGSPYDSACLEGAIELLRDTNYDLRIIDIRRDRNPNERLRQFFSRKGIAGAIIRSTAEDRGLVLDMAEEGLPMVVLGDHFELPHQLTNIAFAYNASEAASREAIEHLISLGHKRIAFAACDRDDGDHYDRLCAYRNVLVDNNLYDESLLCRVPASRFDGAQLIRNLLGRMNRPTAVYFADPLVAIGALNEAQRLGVSVPDELSVVGFDDNETRGSVFPRMSAVCQDSKELGRSTLRVLLQLIEKQTLSNNTDALHEAWFDLGESTAEPPVAPQRVLPSGARIPS